MGPGMRIEGRVFTTCTPVRDFEKDSDEDRCVRLPELEFLGSLFITATLRSS